MILCEQKRKRENSSCEEGSITLLLIGLCALLLLIASVTIAITAVHVERQKLQALADQTSSAVAVAGEEFQLDSRHPEIVMSDEHVRSASLTFLTDSGAYSSFDRLALTDNTGSDGGATAQVELTSYAKVPLVSYILPDGVQITVSSSARAILEQ